MNYSGIGPVLYSRNTRARNFTIRINPRGEVRVTVPAWVSWRRAEVFFVSRQDWVLKKLGQVNGKACTDSMPSAGDSLRIRGRKVPIRLQKGESLNEEAIWRILQSEAMDFLPERVARLSEKYGYQITGLKIRRMKTRWGSCTARKSVNLNSWLVMIPEELCDYVILHELAHTRFPNHGSLFWKELDRTTGGLSGHYRKELRKQKIMCFAGEHRDQ